jgi:hypothetical protein
MDDIEQVFAAQVFNAERDAATARANGCAKTAADQVAAALFELWQKAPDRAAEMSGRYTIYDSAGNAWPRNFDRGNIAPL